MAAKLAEKLIILGDVCKGLLARVYNLTLFKRPASLSQELESICTKLVSDFPSHNGVERARGIDLFSKRAQEISSELRDYYLTFVDVLQFKAAAWELLVTVSSSIVNFKFDVNVDLLTHFMDLYTSFAQLHILVSRVDDAKLMLSAYALAYHKTHGNTEQTFGSISRFIENEYVRPIPSLRALSVEVGLTVGETITALSANICQWSSPDMLKQRKVFDMLDDPGNFTTQKGVKDHLCLLYLDRFYKWAMYGYLLCPAQLELMGALDLIGVVLKNNLQAPVYRDQMLNIHKEYSELFASSFKVNKFKLSKHKKIVVEAHKAASDCAVRHRELRTFLRVELRTLLDFFKQFPQLLAPKMQMVQCCLRLLRNEVLWYFRHLDFVPFKAKRYLKPEEFQDDRVTECIYLVQQMSDLIAQNTKTIQEYYLKYLRGPDSAAIQPVAEAFLRQANVSQGVQELLTQIIGDMETAALDDDFEAVRLNWYRVSAIMNSQQSGLKPNQTAPLNAAMSRVLVHSRNVDRIVSQLKQNASFAGLFWHRTPLHKVLMESLSGTMGQPRHCITLVAILHQGLENVHRFCPEEQAFIGTKAVATADLFFNQIITALASLLSGITIKTNSLRAQTAAIEVVNRMKRHPEYAKKGTSEPLPGYESLYAHRSVVNSLRVWRKSVMEICSAIRDTPSMVIYNTQFIPREWLYEAVQKAIKNALIRIAIPPTGKAIQRPSVLLTQVRDLINAFASIDRHVNINLSDIVREMLYREFSDPQVGGAGDPLGVADDAEQKDSRNVLVHAIASWYVNLVDANLGAMHVTFSRLKNGFTSLPGAKFRAETFADINELQALCTLVGPSGVRVIDRALLTLIESNVVTIKKILQQTAGVLADMRNRFTEHSHWMDQVKRINGLDTAVDKAIKVGCALQFRTLLRKALRDCVKNNVRFVYESVRMMHSVAPENTTMDLKMAPLDYLAADCGIDVGGADHALMVMLKKFKSSPSDQQVWDLLPELYGASFAVQMWKDASYNIVTESHSNNVHCMSACIVALTTVLNGISVDNITIPSDQVKAQTKMDLERFTHNAAHSILNMHHHSEVFSSYNLSSIMVFMEQFIMETNGVLDLSMLEEFFPFTLLRTNYVQMYEKQAVRGVSYAPVVDDDEKQ